MKSEGEGPRVKRLQHLLNTTQLFPHLDETGGFGPGTERAIREFQESREEIAMTHRRMRTWAALLTHWLSGDMPG